MYYNNNSNKQADSENQQQNQFVKQLTNQGNYCPVYLKNGPKEDRKCQDLSFFLLLVALLCYYIYQIANYQNFSENNINKFIIPHDPDGRLCGQGNQQKYKYIYFIDPNNTIEKTVCIENCPQNLQNSYNNKINCLINSLVSSCEDIIKYETKNTANQVCMPKDPQLAQKISQVTLLDDVENFIYNIQNGIPIIVASALISFILGIFLLGWVGFCGSFMTWFFLINFIFFSGILGIVLLFRALSIDIPLIQEFDKDDASLFTNQLSFQKKMILIGLACFCLISSIMSLFYSIFYIKKIRYMIASLKIAAIYCRQNLSIYLIPILLFIILLIFLVLWIFFQIQYLGNASIDKKDKSPFFIIYAGKKVKLHIITQIIILLIIRGFIVAIGDFIISCSSSLWYYQKDDSQHKELPSNVWKSLKWVIQYHLGSMVISGFIFTFSSLIISIGRVIHTQAVYGTTKDKNKYLKYSSLCYLYVCYCFDKWLQFVNKNVYVMMALTGENFVQSTEDAYYLKRRNKQRLQIISNLGNMFNIIGRLFLTIITVLTCYIIINKVEPYKSQITDQIPIIASFLLLSYTTSSLLMDIYGTSADSLILSCFVDEEVEKVHFGREDAYNCPPKIRPLVNELRTARI